MRRTAQLLFPAALALGLHAGSASGPAAVLRQPLHVGISDRYPLEAHILVDQFGYRPGDPKVAVIRDPHVGFDNMQRFTPGARYEVRNAVDDSVVFTGTATPWQGGAVQSSSGDSGWWFDFSPLRTPGNYFVFDAGHAVRSPTFRLQEDVYQPILKAALRMYYYQRAGLAKQPPFADPCWSDSVSYLGADQDSQAHDINDRSNSARVRDLHGGWYDAGDTNKYVTFASVAVHQLLSAYRANPGAFTDDLGIPESGNGIPDILDEIHWETDWLRRMQFADGSAALKVGEIKDTTGVRPGLDTLPRYYIGSCSSATIAVAGVFAHAALEYSSIDALRADAAELRARAVAAWNNYRQSPQQVHCDTGVVKAGIADWNAVEQDSAAVVAAIYLYALTGDALYHEYVKAHYRDTRPYRDTGWSRYNPEQGEALLYYTGLASADPALRARILADKAADVRAVHPLYGFQADADLYRASLDLPQYHWGSNAPRANSGNTNMQVITWGIAVEDPDSYRTRAVEILHYFHGVNPLGMVYLSNMYALGATRSANEIYHTWFWHGTRWSNALASECGPAPGFVPGGPNANAVQNGVPATLQPPAGQPPQKAYRDWNTGWPESAWAITEPGIYYQSAYVELLSKFVR